MKAVSHLVDEDKIKLWQEGGSSTVLRMNTVQLCSYSQKITSDLDEEDKAILDEFLPRTGDVHCMWEVYKDWCFID